MNDEKSVTLKEVLKVLLGNKWVYLLMIVGFFAASLVGFNIYNSYEKEYVSFFDYDVACLSPVTNESGEVSAYYFDGEKFDSRFLTSKEKLKKYIESDSVLEGLDADNLFNNNVIKSFQYTVVYKENDHKMDEKDAAFLEDKKGYELVLDASQISNKQAKVLSKCLSNEVLNICSEKIDILSYSSYLNNYDSCRSYIEKINNLVSGVNYINDLCNQLKTTYGDVILKSDKYGGEDNKYFVESKSVSTWQSKMNMEFSSYYLDSLLSELEVNGYINPDYVDYVTSLKTAVSNLNREITVNEAVLADLKTQRDALVSSVGSGATIESVEIREYNTEIISLTKTIADQKEQVDLYELQLEKLDKSSMTQEEIAAYNANLDNFETRLTLIREKLGFYTSQYEAIAKGIMRENLHVYFDNADIITEKSGLKTGIIVIASIGIALFLPMVINLVVFGFKQGEGNFFFSKKNK